MFGAYRSGKNLLKNRQAENKNHQRQQESQNHLNNDRRTFHLPQLLVCLLAVVSLVARVTEFLPVHNLHYQLSYIKAASVTKPAQICKQDFQKKRVGALYYGWKTEVAYVRLFPLPVRRQTPNHRCRSIVRSRAPLTILSRCSGPAYFAPSGQAVFARRILMELALGLPAATFSAQLLFYPIDNSMLVLISVIRLSATGVLIFGGFPPELFVGGRQLGHLLLEAFLSLPAFGDFTPEVFIGHRQFGDLRIRLFFSLLTFSNLGLELFVGGCQIRGLPLETFGCVLAFGGFAVELLVRTRRLSDIFLEAFIGLPGFDDFPVGSSGLLIRPPGLLCRASGFLLFFVSCQDMRGPAFLGLSKSVAALSLAAQIRTNYRRPLRKVLRTYHSNGSFSPSSQNDYTHSS